MWETIRSILLIAVLTLIAVAYIENSADLGKDRPTRTKKKDNKDEQRAVENKDDMSDEDTAEK